MNGMSSTSCADDVDASAFHDEEQYTVLLIDRNVRPF